MNHANYNQAHKPTRSFQVDVLRNPFILAVNALYIYNSVLASHSHLDHDLRHDLLLNFMWAQCH